jgi:D-alanyl-D-alanine carboxypeptidase
MQRLILLGFTYLIFSLSVTLTAFAQAPAANDKLAAAFDADLAKMFKPNEPGAAVIVVKDGQVIFRKGYGMANLELGVANAPDHIFRIGSITKQFTAVSILMLIEQGKLALTDEITKFLPDYPMPTLAQNHKITVEHLLTHTSGIKSYTDLPEWLPLWRKDLTMTELIDLFKNKPMDFAPGTQMKYNNSGYVLLGAIIEKVSGMKYGEFVEQKIFAPLGMTSSFYDNTKRVIPRRVAGYDKEGASYVNAEYLSMSQPHAAGSLMSTVDDLAKWDAALYTEKLVKQSSLQRAWTSYVLTDGKPTNYGYGWGIGMQEGLKRISHTGGIHGFTCEAVRLPESRVYVAILTNRGGGTGNLTKKFAVLASGKEWKEPSPPASAKPAVAVSESVLERYVGEYQLAPNFSITVTREGAQLFGQATGQQRFEMTPESETKFNIAVVSAQIEFTVEGGKATQLTLNQGGRTMPAKKIK